MDYEEIVAQLKGREAERYVAFLLRLWRDGPERPWRASLQRGLAGRPQHFASLSALFAFLESLPAEQVTDDSINVGGITMTIGMDAHTVNGSTAVIAPGEETIHRLIQRMADGWNAGDGAASAADYADDAVHVVWNGMRVQGREAVAQGHQRIFDNVYLEREMTMEATHIHFLRPDVAMVECTARLGWSDDGERRNAETKSLVVMTEEDGRWQIRAFHNTMVQDRS